MSTPPMNQQKDQSIQRMCEKGTLQGKGLFLASKDYPKYYPQQTGFNCSCQVVFGANKVLKVAAIDLRLCSSGGRCGRSLNIGDAQPISVTNTKEEDPSLTDSIYGIVGMKEIYSDASAAGHVTMELTDVDSKDDLYLWLYLYAEGSDMTVTCNDETTFTTPTTTTTTTTTPTTSTTPTTPTRSTTPTTTSKLTTPATTTSTTTSSTTTTKHETAKPVTPKMGMANIGFNIDKLCNCERVTTLSPKLYLTAECPDGWTKFGSSCYRLFRKTHQAWPEAVFECEKHGALLASFETKAEHNHIPEMMEIFNVLNTDNVWVGLSDVREEGVFVWESTRQKAAYLPWGKNEPNQGTTQEDCVMLFGRQSHTYSDDVCTLKYSYLCEKPVNG